KGKMRRFGSPAAFRSAVDARLRNYARKIGVPAIVVRRQAALERIMARLMKVATGQWALKGGLALDTRLGERARSSMDMDLDHARGAEPARDDLVRGLAADLNDHFSFTITGTEDVREGNVNLAVRYSID